MHRASMVVIGISIVCVHSGLHAEKIVSARVNGEPVYYDSVAIIEASVVDQKDLSFDEILEELINLKLLSQAARDAGLDQDTAVSLAIDLQADQTLANAYTSNVARDIKVSQLELREEYDRQVARLENQEYRVSHILLFSEEAASQVAEALDSGAQFTELVLEHTMDVATSNGGDLGWMTYGSSTIEHSETIELLDVGERTDPLETEYGWHIFQLTDTRGAIIPNYESIRDELYEIIVRGKMVEHLEKIRTDAEISVSER